MTTKTRAAFLITGPEYDTILAGLRAIQCLMDGRQVSIEDFDDILTCNDRHAGLGTEDIDDLVNELQSGQRDAP